MENSIMLHYYVIYLENVAVDEYGSEIELRVVECRDVEVARKLVDEHPEAKVIRGEEYIVELIPRRVEFKLKC
jgi:hypothetical protein